MTPLKNVLGPLLAASVLMTATAAFADRPGPGGPGHSHPGSGPGGPGGPGHGGPGQGPAAAPELAGKGAPAALALITAGAAIVVSRRRRAT